VKVDKIARNVKADDLPAAIVEEAIAKGESIEEQGTAVRPRALVNGSVLAGTRS
jgi:hypothetical protein